MIIDTLFEEFRQTEVNLEEKLKIPEVSAFKVGETFSIKSATASFKYLPSEDQSFNHNFTVTKITDCLTKIFNCFKHGFIIPAFYPEGRFKSLQTNESHYFTLISFSNYVLEVTQTEERKGTKLIGQTEYTFTFTLKTLYRS